MIDRLSIRERPSSPPVMHQTWGKLLFLHWAFPPEVIRPHVPSRLTLDTFNGQAWVSITPFTMWDVRAHGLPAVPLANRTHELNVRTYVHLDGEAPGIWFFSLDAVNPLAVIGARATYALPYFQASMQLREIGEEIHFTSRRMHPGSPEARFSASWRGGDSIGEPETGTHAFFLVERYALYAKRGRTLYRARIHHRPWPLREATLISLSSTMFESHGMPSPNEVPLLHMQAEPLPVEVWPLERV